MADLLDSGTRRTWETGAVRDAADGKGRCDLLPLDVIYEYIGDGVLKAIETYITTGNVKLLWIAIQHFSDQKDWSFYDMLLEVSKQYEDGAVKYGDNNWRKGIPIHCYIDSAVRHYLKYCRGDEDEPHDRAVCWNLLCAIWTHKNKPEMIDLSFRQNDEETGR
jgi:hypothetical protein